MKFYGCKIYGRKKTIYDREQMINNPDMEVPDFTPTQIASLPNIFELIDFIKSFENKIHQQSNGWQDYSLTQDGGMKLHPFPDINSEDRVYINDADDKQFIPNRLGSKRYCLKPNLRTHRFIFRGQKQHFKNILSSAERGDDARFLLSNVRAEDFILLLRTHPLFMMFDRGIYLPPLKKTMFLEMNYYGLAQHYNFSTGLVDFTTDISAAAFFATTENHGADVYKPYGGSPDNPFGVIYVHEINPFMSFKALGYRTVGLQIYPRTGAQSGLFYEKGGTRMPVERTVKPFYFRHDITCARKVFELMDEGKKLFPEDDLSSIAKDIIQSNEISGEAFAHNNFVNQDNFEENEKKLKDHGITINWHKRRVFTPDMLQKYYAEVKSKLWPALCGQIDFVDSHGDELMESLLNIPNNPYYQQYFDPRQLELLQYHALSDVSRARRNAMTIQKVASSPEGGRNLSPDFK